MFGEGISKSGELVDLGVDHGIMEKSGSWYSYEGTKIAQGRDGAKQFLLDNPEVASEIEQKLKDKLHQGTLTAKVEMEDTEAEA